MDKKIKEIEKQNDEYLEIFVEDLLDAGLTQKTIRNHASNVGFYINDFILYHYEEEMKESCKTFYVNDFFGYFFVRKCMWSTPSTIKSTAASLKKFYRSMYQHGYLEEKDYKDFCEIVKDNMSSWQEECAEYNNDSYEFY